MLNESGPVVKSRAAARELPHSAVKAECNGGELARQNCHSLLLSSREPSGRLARIRADRVFTRRQCDSKAAISAGLKTSHLPAVAAQYN
jgi:hypothetical protein